MTDIRSVDATNLEEFVKFWNAHRRYPQINVPWLERDIESLPPHLQADRYLMVRNGDTIALLELSHDAGAYDPQNWHLELMVRPENRRQGFGTAFHAFANAKIRRQPWRKIETRVDELDSAGIEFALRLGYTESKRDWTSELELSHEPPPLPELDGIQILSMAAADSPEFRRDLHAAFEEIRVDTPRTSPPVPLEFTLFESQVLDDPAFDLANSFIAVDSGEIVGFTGIYEAENRIADQWLTGVRRSHRGKGIAKALKIHAIHAARAAGYVRIVTDNDVRNAPMLAINDALGFERRPWMATYVLHNKG